MSIYVEILIRAPIDVLWAHTQTPELHERWDPRFSRIEYAPSSTAEPHIQRFSYTTRLGLGLAISGDAHTIAHADPPDGSRCSSLRFASAHPLSIIREGSGYWKYIPALEHGIDPADALRRNLPSASRCLRKPRETSCTPFINVP